MIEYVSKRNKDSNNSHRFYVGLVKRCLTTIYQPQGIMYNKPFKTLIRPKKNSYVTNEILNNNMTVGDKCCISKDILLEFVCKIIDNLNKIFEAIEVISKSFE